MKKTGKRILGLLLAVLMLVGLAVPTGVLAPAAKAAAGDVPDHSKKISDNGDGTYKIELTVTGDADDETDEAGNVNVLVIYDTSSSMTSTAQGSSYTRADQAEDVVHDFLTNLAGYQNDAKDNINVALVTFARAANQHNAGQDWTTNVTGLANRFDDGGTNRATSLNYSGTQSNGTNWEAALTAANTLLGSAPGGENTPTFVIMMTDGACTASGNGINAIAPNGATIGQLRPFYEDATSVARNVNLACTATKGTFYGIYAYGTEADLLDDLMYYAANGGHRGDNINNVIADTEEAPNFFLAADTAGLNAAITKIFNEVVTALGISSVSISDGTTNEVTTSSGAISKLLEVDKGSYQYWLSIPVVNNKFTRKINVMVDGVSQAKEIEYTVTDNGDGTCTVTWTEGSADPSVTVDGTISSGEFKYEWTEANDLYNYDPPAAEFKDGAVDWDISAVNTLLDGVTYSMTFDVYPSQTTLDIVADIKNNPGEDGAWADLDPNIQKYIDVNGNLETNTTASLSYKDTREENPEEHTTTFDNPPAVSNSAVQQMTVAKEWENELDEREQPPVTLDVTRDGTPVYTVTLGDKKDADGNPIWEDTVYISIGIIKDGKPLAGSEGHDFTFVEQPGESGVTFYWQLNVPTVHPMLIGKDTVMLIKEDEKHPVPDGATTYTINGSTYYVDEEIAALTAINERRSSLNLKKIVEGEDIPEDAEFPFTLNVVNSLAPKEEPTNDPGYDSDWWVWISVRDMSETDDPDKAPPVNDAVISGAIKSEYDGWYIGVSGEDIELTVKNGYSIRLNNLPTDTTYTITEGDLSKLPGFTFGSAEIEAIEGEEPENYDTAGQAFYGEIEATNTLYQVTFTNKYELIDINVDKVWDDNDDQDGKRPDPEEFTLTLNGLPEGTEAPEPEIEIDGNTWTYTWKAVPRYDAQGNELTYTVTEAKVPEGYECKENEVKDGGTITNTHETENTSVTVTKVWEDNDDQDGIRPETLALTLNGLPEGTKAPEPKITKEGNTWTYKWSNVPKFNDGDEIKYTVTEETIPDGYSCKSATVDAGGTITNSYTPDATTVKVTKVWDDNSDQDGVRPDSLTLTLKGDGKEIADVTPEITKSEDGNTWTYTWSGLPKNSDGNAIEYTVTEAKVPEGYECKENEVKAGGTITNTHTAETVDVTVTKVWDDEDDKDGKRPASLELTLEGLPEGVKAPEPKVTKDGSKWTYTWSGLPKYSAGEES